LGLSQNYRASWIGTTENIAKKSKKLTEKSLIILKKPILADVRDQDAAKIVIFEGNFQLFFVVFDGCLSKYPGT
jgi:hypothetical protein